MFARSNLLPGAAAAAALFAVPAQASMNISASPTRNVSCSASVCTPTNKGAVLNVTDLQNLLASSDVTVNTGAGAVTIEITSPLTWSSTHHLTLNAAFNVSIRAPVAVEGTSGLSISCNNGGQGGQFQFFSGGKIDFWDASSSFSVNGTSYVLVDDLATLASDTASAQSGAYAIAKDYDAGPDGTYQNGVDPAGFAGTLEGLGHTVSNLSVVGSSGKAAGMFGEITGATATVRDLTLANVNVQATYSGWSGAFIGLGDNAASLFGVSSSGTVGGGKFTGGLVGQTRGSITASHSSATVGGGYDYGSVGGLAGVASAITGSSFTGHIASQSFTTVGGLVGASGGPISQSFVNASIDARGNSYAGGITGYIGSPGSITNSYALGEITARHYSTEGGMLGAIGSGTISTSYSANAVNFITKARRKSRVGGFGGRYDSGTLTSDYFDIDTSGRQHPCANPCNAVKGLSDAALKSGLPSGFDPTIWAESPSINNGYPYLIANPPQ